ncbi:aspartate/glutamate racemase family protein [Verrucosispora sp. NA02020]|uniref:maleate cis-trans isomerase family protein n=1 Tax=Verrucosispora sp. NA02020 TaxID=2742132 RepID=UPI00159099DB|nr:aspartate/glutamate racemase family protein [Verrucosispora sp. NA02020]QKW13456.1 aspartate/glutamate racemase family protein [Verrucosispora sp. NA02020]
MSLGFGTAARIGHLYPSGGLCDYELQLMAPDGVQLVTTRMPFRRSSLADDHALLADLEAHSRLLADAEVDLIAMNCTAATLLAGPESVNARIHASTGLPSTTTIEAVLDALERAGIGRIALLTPYVEEVTSAEVELLTARGLEVVSVASLPCATPVEQATHDPQVWRDLAAGLGGSTADGLLISCAGIRLAPVLAAIEEDFGRPVVASNQALLWHCLRICGVAERPPGYGALLAGEFD